MQFEPHSGRGIAARRQMYARLSNSSILHFGQLAAGTIAYYPCGHAGGSHDARISDPFAYREFTLCNECMKGLLNES